MIQPAALIRAHSAPMVLRFLNAGFGASMQHGFITALRGSWNTTAPNNFRGFKVIYGHLSSGQDTTVDYVADFCSGFLTDTVNRVFWGRPVGIATENDGTVYISSDEGNRFILVLTPDKATGIINGQGLLPGVGAVFPNPANKQATLPLTLTRAARVTATLYDVAGKEVRLLIDETLSTGTHNKQLDVNGLPSGAYLLTIMVGNSSASQRLLLGE